MTYLLAQLWFYLLLALLLGSLLGWILRGGCKKTLKTMSGWERKYTRLQKESSRYKKKVEKLNQLMREKNLLLSETNAIKQQKIKLAAKLNKVQQGVSNIRTVHGRMKTRLRETSEKLLAEKQANLEKNNSLKQIKMEASATEHLLMKCQDEWDAKHRVLRSQWDVSQLEIKSAKEELERTKEENKGLKSELKIVQSQLEETEQKRTEAELKTNDVDQLTTQLEETNRKLFEAESNVDEINMLTKKLQHSEQEVNDVNTQFDEFKEHAKEFIDSISEKNKKYISTIDSLEGDVEQVQQKISSQEQEIKGTNAIIDMMESTISSLREENILLMTSNNKMEEEPVSNRLVSEKDEGSKIRSDRKTNLRSKGMTTSTSSYNPNLLARWKQIKKSKLRRRLRK